MPSPALPSLLLLVPLGVVVFASTNIDDLFVLLAFFSDPAYRARHVVAGQLAGMAILVGASITSSLMSVVVPMPYIGLLGLAPLAMGIVKLVQWRRQDDPGDPAAEARRPGHAGHIVTIAAVTMGNGGDNLAVYVPLFATRRWWQVAVLSATFLVMTALWCWLAHRLVKHPRLGAPIRRYGQRLLPFVLIGLGGYILVESGAVRAVVEMVG